MFLIILKGELRHKMNLWSKTPYCVSLLIWLLRPEAEREREGKTDKASIITAREQSISVKEHPVCLLHTNPCRYQRTGLWSQLSGC